eukprot:GILK01009578.1.p1 GENE.GILK01009578.1~~GILK01009578.1.p1  ORF type:complete len:454 (-),score=51.25 GILK01009578.1:335-1657(-)
MSATFFRPAEYGGTDDSDEACSVDWEESEEEISPPRVAAKPRRVSMSATDTDEEITKEQAEAGKDIQGLPWETLYVTRAMYRERRLLQYSNYKNLTTEESVQERLEQEILKPRTDGSWYQFWLNSRAARCSVIHFQLRHLICCTSPYDVYLMNHFGVYHWNPLSKKVSSVLNLAGDELGTGRVQVSSISANCDYAVAGGFFGEIYCVRLSDRKEIFNTRVTYDENAITNFVSIGSSPGHNVRLLTCNNDGLTRIFDLPTMTLLHTNRQGHAVNHASLSPDHKTMVTVGDSTDAYIADIETGQTITTLQGHVDYGFASAWHPHGLLVATGNQDMTCRIWDIRHCRSSLAVLGGRLGAIRSIHFSDDGELLSMAEPADFVHVFEVSSGFRRSQVIDLFGEVAGISFAPHGASALFIGVADRTYGSLMEFRRKESTNLSSIVL